MTALLLLSLASLPAHATPPEVLARPLARLVLGWEESQIVRRLTKTASPEIGAAEYRDFLQRLDWGQHRELRRELTRQLEAIERELEAYRARQGRPAGTGASERLAADEEALLRRLVTERLATPRIDDLLDPSRAFVEVRASGRGYGNARERFVKADDAAARGSSAQAAPIADHSRRANGEPDVIEAAPPLPASEAARLGTDLRQEKLRFHQRMALRFGAYDKLFRMLVLKEGQVRSWFTRTGRVFTADDLRVIRKINRLLGVLNEYTRTRLVIRAFTAERVPLYRQLNESTAESTERYLRGEIGAEDYLRQRGDAARELGLNDIVNEAERRMLRAIERVKTLGGGRHGADEQRGLIEVGEENLAIHDDNIARSRDFLRQSRDELEQARRRGAPSAKLEAIRRDILREQADEALWLSRKQTEIENLERLYAEFIGHFDSLELFANLRLGRLGATEKVPAMPLPDAFALDPSEVERWTEIFDRALANSTNTLVRTELRELLRAQAGQTRKFINTMNRQTAKVMGQKFTETQYGHEFRAYSRSLYMTVITRASVALGLSTPITGPIAEEWFNRAWDAVFAEEASRAEPDDENPPAGTPPPGAGRRDSADENPPAGTPPPGARRERGAVAGTGPRR